MMLCMPPHSSHLLQPLDIGCFGPLKKAYGREVEHVIRRPITHISKTEFFLAVYTAFQATITERNIKGGFNGTGIVPFDPESVVSKLDVQLRIPTPAEKEASQAQPWTSKTPETGLEAQSQSKDLERRINKHQSSSPESIIEASKSNTKALKAPMHEVALLKARVRDLEEADEILSRRRRAKRSRLQNRGKITIDEAREGVDQMDADIQVQAESLRSGGRGGLV
jgi:hypothetical protein